MAHVISLPPDRREFLSPTGNFVLALCSDDHWKTPRATAELLSVDGALRRPLWQRVLPHDKGPHRALVNDTGAVVLIDEWTLAPSHHALVCIGPDGQTLAQYSTAQLARRLGVARKTVAARARRGRWLSRVPVLRADGSAVDLRAGGRRLVLQLADGRLQVAD